MISNDKGKQLVIGGYHIKGGAIATAGPVAGKN